MNVKMISANELLELLNKQESIQLIDLRESYELETEGKSDAMHIPMGELVDRINEIPEKDKIVFHCSSGKRSLNMLSFLLMNGMYKDNFYHLEGGYQELMQQVNEG